jgi:hypothetical protein
VWRRLSFTRLQLRHRLASQYQAHAIAAGRVIHFLAGVRAHPDNGCSTYTCALACVLHAFASRSRARAASISRPWVACTNFIPTAMAAIRGRMLCRCTAAGLFASPSSSTVDDDIDICLSVKSRCTLMLPCAVIRLAIPRWYIPVRRVCGLRLHWTEVAGVSRTAWHRRNALRCEKRVLRAPVIGPAALGPGYSSVGRARRPAQRHYQVYGKPVVVCTLQLSPQERRRSTSTRSLRAGAAQPLASPSNLQHCLHLQ